MFARPQGRKCFLVLCLTAHECDVLLSTHANRRRLPLMPLPFSVSRFLCPLFLPDRELLRAEAPGVMADRF